MIMGNSDRAAVTPGPHAVPSAQSAETAEELYEHPPCGYLSTAPDGRIVRVNSTLLSWLGHSRDQVVERMTFSDLLTVGGRVYHETHFAPLLRMQGRVGGVARAAQGRRRQAAGVRDLRPDT